MLIRATNGTMDVGNKVAGNLSIANMVAMGDAAQSNLAPVVRMAPHPSSISPVMSGQWFAVPDDMFRLKRTDRTPVIGAATEYLEWTLPNGSKILFAEFSAVKFTTPMWWYSDITDRPVSNVRVKLTGLTRAGLVACGIISNSDATDIISNAPPEPPSVLDTINNVVDQGEDAVSNTAFAVIVVALLIAALVYIPKGILK